MRVAMILLLLCFWMFLAYRAFARGETGLAAVFAIVGAALAAYRLSR